jgi:hypothetical protein
MSLDGTQSSCAMLMRLDSHQDSILLSEQYTDWLNMSPPNGEPPAYLANVLQPSALYSSPYRSPRLPESWCPLSDGLASAVHWDIFPFVARPSHFENSSAPSTPVSCFCTKSARSSPPAEFPQVSVSKHKSQASSDTAFDQHFKFSFTDWTLSEPFGSPIARMSLMYENGALRQCESSHLFNIRNPTSNETRNQRSVSPDLIKSIPHRCPAFGPPTIDPSLPVSSPALETSPLESGSNLANSVPASNATLLSSCTITTSHPCHNLGKVSSGRPILFLSQDNTGLLPSTTAAQMDPSLDSTGAHADPILPTYSPLLSPLTPLSECSNSAGLGISNNKRKRPPSPSPSHLAQSSRLIRHAQRPTHTQEHPTPRATVTRSLTSETLRLNAFPNRTFPEPFKSNLEYPLFYRQFYLSSYYQFENEELIFLTYHPNR